MQKLHTKLGLLIVLFLVSFALWANGEIEEQSTCDQPIVTELKEILKQYPEMEKLLVESIHQAEWPAVPTLSAYYDFLNDLVTWIPNSRDILKKLLEFYWFIDQDPGLKLQEYKVFNDWMVKFAKDWGSFLDTTESAEKLETFITDPAYHITNYMEGPSGWLTFNEFFARHIRPGKRPVDSPCDDNTIVSPADSKFVEACDIDENSTITAKGITYKISELMDGSPYQSQFENGILMHNFLNVDDYHRYHVPVGGEVVELRKIEGKVYLEVIRKDDGSLKAVDGTGYQFTQMRGLIVIKTDTLGYVAVLPIGMAQVSSVNLTTDVGAIIEKGDEFGYFKFGGSDIVVLFQKDMVEITMEKGVKYLQGREIAHKLVD